MSEDYSYSGKNKITEYGPENLNHHSEKLKTGKLGNKIPNSGFIENRRFRRRFQRLMKNRKVLKAEQEMIKFQKFSTICAVAAVPVSGEEGLVKLFLMMSQEAWRLFLKIGDFILQSLKKFGTFLMKLILQHPYFSLFAVFTSCALLLFNHLATKFGRKLQWYDRLLIIVLALLATLLLSVVIKTEALKTIIEWLKKILIQIIMGLRSLTSLLDSHMQDKDLVSISKPKSSKGEDLKVFVFFSVITAITTRCLLELFKRKVVGDGPLTTEIINILELDIDLSDYLPKVGRNS